MNFKNTFILVSVIAACASLGFVGALAANGCSEAGQVVQEEFGPRESLEKYEWFKDTSAALDKKRADIEIMEKRVERLEQRYKENNSRTSMESLNQGETELAGVVLSYNELASKYNSQMAKFNWAFANQGTLPKGATEPLPKEYAAYMRGEK